jgi:5'-3' exonuclease
MRMKYVVVDLSNLFSRCRHVVKGEPDPSTKAAIAISIVFRSLRKIYREFGINHIVFAIDYGSWRYGTYPMYKARRKVGRLEMSPAEQEEDQIFYDYLNELIEYFDNKTKCTVLRERNIEGDDFVARFIQNHPNDDHIIVSADSDFIQMLAPNVKIYDGVNERTITTEGVTDAYGKKLEFKIDSGSGKLKVGKPNLNFEPEKEWWKKALFVKLVRGDSGDGVMSAYPGISYKGTSKRIGIEQAWEDREEKGYNWNNFMLQEWKKPIGVNDDGDPIKVNVRVVDEYKINESVIDLTKQPDEIKSVMDKVITDATSKEMVSRNIGFDFIKFCVKHDLPGLQAETDHASYLNMGYPKSV